MSSTFTYSIVMLGIQGTRTLGAILLAAEVEFGICLTNLTFFLLIQFLPPLVFLCVLCPYMQTTQSHSLLNQTSSFRVGVTDDDDWLEDDYDLYLQLVSTMILSELTDNILCINKSYLYLQIFSLHYSYI